MRKRALCVSVLALGLGSCNGWHGSAVAPSQPSGARRTAASAGIDWPTFGFNRQRWSYNANETVLTSGTVANLKLKWSYTLGTSHVDTQPVVASNVKLASGRIAQIVYAADENSDFVALDASNGSLLWSKRLGKANSSCWGHTSNGITSAPVIDHKTNRIYVLDGAGTLAAFDLATGTQVAAFPPLHAFSNPNVYHAWSGLLLDAANAMLYYPTASHCDVGTYFSTINAVNVSTQQVTTFNLVVNKSQYYGNGVWGWGGESIDPQTGNLYAGVGNSLGNLGEAGQYSDSVIDLTSTLQFVADEQPESNLQGDQDIGTTPVLYNEGGKCAAFERKDGNFFTLTRDNLVNEQYGTKLHLGGQLAAPAYSPSLHALYASAPSGLTRLNPGAGCTASVAWRTNIGASGMSVPAGAADVVYASGGSTLYAIDAQNGTILWNSASTIGGQVVAEPTIVNGRVYAAAWDGRLYAFGL